MKQRLLPGLFGIFLLLPFLANAQVLDKAEFIDQPVKEILLSLASLANENLFVDESVEGSASYVFVNKTFEEALALVLTSRHLYENDKSGLRVISKLGFKEAEPGLFSLEADEISLELLLISLARETASTILYDDFASQKISVHVKSAPLDRILSLILEKLPGFSLESQDTYFYLRNEKTSKQAPQKGPLLAYDKGLYSIQARSVRLGDVLEELFKTEGKEFMLLKRSDALLERIVYENKAFDELLSLILEAAEADFSIRNGIYYILELPRNELIRKLNETQELSLKYISVANLMSLLPPGLLGSTAIKLDKSRNSVLLNGSREQCKPLLDFIALVDKPLEGQGYYRFDLANISPETLIPLLPENLKSPEPLVLKNQNAFLMVLSPERYEEAKDFIRLVDLPRTPYVIKLKYIKAEDFLNKLPSTINKELVSLSLDQRYVFFSGTQAQYKDLLKTLQYIDLKTPQIKYQVLVVQYQESHTQKLGLDLSRSSEKVKASDYAFLGDSKTLALLGNFGATLSLGFDVINEFGYLFAANLSADLQSQKAQIMLDTTLNALSNEDVTFKNTNTTRYYTYETTQDSGSTTSTEITKEIVSGIVITLKGWVSGDGMITIRINSTITKEGDASGEGSLPQTYEKVISTTIRTPSGQAIAVGGLMQQDTDTAKKLLSLGMEAQNTELRIYIIPRVEPLLFYEASLEEGLMYLYDNYSLKAQPQKD